jgi:hypothetical protein
VSSNPAPFSGTLAHQSAMAAGEHQQIFTGATATLTIGTGDTLYAYVYLDPANPPSEVMLQWNDGSWEHRAYWGGNSLVFGTDGTASRRYMGSLPATGQWVQLKVPASQVNLEGSTLNGMAFTLYGGRATWDTTGNLSSNAGSGTANGVPVSLVMAGKGATLSWPSSPTRQYQVSYKNSLSDPIWTDTAQLTATNNTSSWQDPGPLPVVQRFYRVAQLN